MAFPYDGLGGDRHLKVEEMPDDAAGWVTINPDMLGELSLTKRR